MCGEGGFGNSNSNKIIIFHGFIVVVWITVEGQTATWDWRVARVAVDADVARARPQVGC